MVFDFEVWKAQLSTIPEHLLIDALRAVMDERKRREDQVVADAAQREVVECLRDEGVVEGPTATDQGGEVSEWKNPGTLHHRMYLRGDRVRHAGRVWVSTHPGLNHWEPGGTGIDDRIWRETTIPSDTTPTEPPAPEPDPETAPDGTAAHPFPWEVGAHYLIGQHIIHEGTTYILAQDHTAAAHWPPGPGLEAIYQQV